MELTKKSKVLLVLGASSDIGLGFIKKVANDYDFVIGHFNSASKDLEDLQEALGGKLMLFSANFNDKNSTNNMIEMIINNGLIPVHILHLPAVAGNIKRFPKIGWDEFEKRIFISLRSIVLILEALLPKMSKEGGGKVVIMLTIHTTQKPLKGCADYVTEKYALLGLIKALASEYEGKGITFNGVSPGAIDTKFNEQLPDFVLEQYAAGSKSGNNLKVDEILPDIEYLFSKKCDNVTGKNFIIDGSGLNSL